MAKRRRKLVEQHYTWDIRAQELKIHYDEIKLAQLKHAITLRQYITLKRTLL